MSDSSTTLLAQGENLFFTLHALSLTIARKCASKRRGESNKHSYHPVFDTGCTQSHVMELVLKDGENVQAECFYWIMKYFLVRNTKFVVY